MSWTEEKVNKLKELWGKGQTASQIAEILGGVSRNAVIGKAHRLNLSSKIKTRNFIQTSNVKSKIATNEIKFKGKRSKFKSLILDKDFEPAKNLDLEELTEDTCKYMEGNPDEKDAKFCGRKNVEKLLFFNDLMVSANSTSELSAFIFFTSLGVYTPQIARDRL